ncbi:MAG: hypothetical protein ACFFB5_21780 [Promethearchaeota archaeon]
MISRRFSQSLKRFMPSADQIVTSIISLLEILRVNIPKYSKITIHKSNVPVSNEYFSTKNGFIPLNSSNVTENNTFLQNYGHNNILKYLNSFSSCHNNGYFIQEKLMDRKKYSNDVNLKFFGRNEKIKTNPAFLMEGLFE